jgi:hypothetical protein
VIGADHAFQIFQSAGLACSCNPVNGSIHSVCFLKSSCRRSLGAREPAEL